jgi:hypothetical protein
MYINFQKEKGGEMKRGERREKRKYFMTYVSVSKWIYRNAIQEG